MKLQAELARREAVSICNTCSFKVRSSVQLIPLNLTVFSNWCSSAVYMEEAAVYVFVCWGVDE